MAAGSWSLAEELFARGDAAFADELRRIHDADRLAKFAPRWLADPRPFARAALLDYLARPLNAYRHEPLVKRLFKLAEKAGDDDLMGALVVAFDRTVRRDRRTVTRYRTRWCKTRGQAEAAVAEWAADGYTGQVQPGGGRSFLAVGTRTAEEVSARRNDTMPRPPEARRAKNQQVSDRERPRFERCRLFSPATRRYLRRRAWRYFRTVGKADPARYVRAAAGFLARYTDADTDTDNHLLDNWGLMHALFRHCPAVACPAKGWAFAAGKSIADLTPAPRFAAAWAADPDAAFGLLTAAGCRAVRQFAVWLLRTHHADWLAARPAADRLRLADHPDPDVSAFGFDLLDAAADLDAVPVADWLRRLDGDDLDRLERLAALLTRRLDPARVPTADALRLAAHRSQPVARLGLALLGRRTFAEADAPALLGLANADCETARPALTGWLQGVLDGFGPARPEWVLEFLDSKFADVRAAGWRWLHASPLRDDPLVWQRLVESPYDDIRGPLVAALAERADAAEPDAVRLLWAAVLLNVARGGRHKPGVVAKVAARLTAHPADADRLLPLLAVAVRSVRGPEFRAGLAAVVTLAENNPDLRPAVRQRFPELEL